MEEGGNKRKHPGWQYIILDDPKDTNTCKCMFCGKITKGGVCRATNHLVGGNRNVKACLKCPTNVREELKEYQTRTKARREESNALPTYEDLTLIEEDDEDEMEVVGGSGSGSGSTSTPMNKRTRINTGDNVSSMGGRGRGSGSGSGSSNSCSPSVLKPPRPKGPIDKFVYQHPGKVVDDRNRLKRLKQSTITEKYDKEGRDATVQFIMRWIYQAGISLNTIRLRSFEVMLEAVGQFGPGLIPPSYHEARVTYLKKEVQYTKNLMGDHEVEWKRNGCSLMSDGWTDRRDRTLINFLVHSSVGTLFMESIDASSCIKTGEKIFQLLDGMVEKIGEENVVQVVTDNASNYVLAGKLLEAKRPHLYWTPCAAHCLDLILEDIGKIEQVKRCLRKAVALSGFIYNHLYVLNMMREFTNQHELVRPAVTRFATSFLTLASIHRNKANLRKMFISEKWTTSKWAKDPKGKRAAETVMMPSFWNSVVHTLKHRAPLVRVLRLVDGDKPAMGYIYEVMDRAKEAIKSGFNGNEAKYRPIWEIVDKRWDCQLHRPLHAAGYYLNPSLFYDNKERIMQDPEVMDGLIKVIERLIPSIDDQVQCSIELELYNEAKGMFSSNVAIRTRGVKTPAAWWSLYGVNAPILRKLAMRVLSLTCSASGCERNWSVFEHEVDPCEDLTDDDIRTAIQNATGPKSALFVPEVPFEVLIRKQIFRLLDPSLQCARFIYDELVKISHHCVVNELQRFPVLRKRMDEVMSNFLREGLEPSETMIGHIIYMEMDYINTSHPNFLGGSKAVEIALQQVKSSRVSLPISRQKDGLELDKAMASERSLKSRGILARQLNGIVADQAVRPLAEGEKVTVSGGTGSSSWGISSIFGSSSSDNRASAKEISPKKSFDEPTHSMEQSVIQLREPPTVLRPSESHTEQEANEIAITKLLLRSYYDIVRNKIEDSVPKAIMHFLVKHTKRELHNVFIRKLYRENLFEEMLQEPDDVATKRGRTRETLRVLQEAFRTLDELPLEAETVEKGYNVGSDPMGLPKICGLPPLSMYSTSSSGDPFSASPRHLKSRKSSPSGELLTSFHPSAGSNGGGFPYMPGHYSSADPYDF